MTEPNAQITTQRRVTARHGPGVGSAVSERFLRGVTEDISQGQGAIPSPRATRGKGGSATAYGRDLAFVCEVVHENADTITVTALATGEEIEIAKPWELMGSIASRTDNGEDQIILPPYTVGDYLTASSVIGPIYQPGTTTTVVHSVSGDRIYIMDENRNARAWAKAAA